ncbi:helicase associated domain-containing protein [Streptomyces sp. NPDC057582]|uniref:helicase associated domain-containing protein n=1 Tax=Streptomyces sp. NPDC057582 TaxID=3346174 RepID=UPI00368F03D1
MAKKEPSTSSHQPLQTQRTSRSVVAVLVELGVKPAARPQKAAARASANAGAAKDSDAFTRGVAALAQYIAREGKTVVGRGHVEKLPDGTTVRLGVFLSNQKTRRHRLTEQQLAALANLGHHWA